ncbi:MAG: hypothetical protein JO314_10645 [Acidobacteria bacterium]|nr:hypothetical protein [Acidobacteriota bacterium]
MARPRTDATHSIKRKLLHAGGWQVVKRAAKSVPFGGTAVAVVLVGSDIKNKGVVKGIINSGIDAIPVVGLVKNGVELFTGDFIADKPKKARRLKGNGK